VGIKQDRRYIVCVFHCPDGDEMLKLPPELEDQLIYRSPVRDLCKRALRRLNSFLLRGLYSHTSAPMATGMHKFRDVGIGQEMLGGAESADA
jgi:hypothetical protein